MVACGRNENGEDGIYVHTDGFYFPDNIAEKFAFRSGRTRETSFSIDYDVLYDLLNYEREEGFILWVLGPAVVFDHDSREAFSRLVEEGYVHALLAGNALATHDIEGAIFGTALGQEIYSKHSVERGHYRHLDALNTIRKAGSIKKGTTMDLVKNGIMKTIIEKGIPYVLAGSIRDDGPLPEVIGDVYKAQAEMRVYTRRATTVVALATQLHSIATGNLLPAYTLTAENQIRPVYFSDVTAAMKGLIERCGRVARANGNLLMRKVGAAVVAVRRAGSIHTLDTINHLFQHAQMIIPGSTYWNMGMGGAPGHVESDAEGLQTPRSLLSQLRRDNF